jgi:hypothetical protein
LSDTSTEPAAPDIEADRVKTLGEMIREEIAKALGNHGSVESAAEPDQPDVAAETRREVARLKAEEDRKAQREARAARVDAAVAKMEAIKEKQPREYRRSTRFMGWVDKEDE